MKKRLSPLLLARALFVAAGALSSPAAFAVGEATTYAPGDLFIGFRQQGVTNTLAVSIGGVAKYIPTALGGTWDGNPFQVQFGLVPPGNPGAGNAVFSLDADLDAVFTQNWATNPAAEDGSGVRWSIAGITSTVANNDPINGFGQSSIFLSKAETTPGVRSSAPSSYTTTTFQGNFTSFTSGIGGGNYTGKISTSNSNKAYIGSGEDADNWGKRIGAITAAHWGTGRQAEQALNGPFSGPTDSVQDLYVRAGTGSTFAAAGTRTYLGSFDLASDGTLLYSAVPEPGAALFGAGAALLGLTGWRKRSRAAALTERAL